MEKQIERRIHSLINRALFWNLNEFSSYLEDFPGFEEPRIFLAAEREQDVQADSVQLLLGAEPVPVPGGPRGALGAAAALPARILDQVLLPTAERHRLRGAVGLHVCGVRVRVSLTSAQV